MLSEHVALLGLVHSGVSITVECGFLAESEKAHLSHVCTVDMNLQLTAG